MSRFSKLEEENLSEIRMPQKNRKTMFGVQGGSIDLINKIMKEGLTQADDVEDPKTAAT